MPVKMSNGVTILQNSNDKNWCLKFYINKIKVHKNNKKNVKRNLHFLSNLRSYGSGFGTWIKILYSFSKHGETV